MPSRRPKLFHEIRDPIHVFVRMDSHERKVVDSRPLQRLRGVHQLGMSHLVYPGATHKRFEHSLGVMELAGRIFDVVTRQPSGEVLSVLPELDDTNAKNYWRTVLRLAALCHDSGHLPFSHAAEDELLPEGWDHERITGELLRDTEIRELFNTMTPPVREEDVVKLALGGKKAKGVAFSNWEAILSEIIVGDIFGADRMDYLLRDSHHAGVAYGKFDHHRLIDTMRILPTRTPTEGGPGEPVLGVEEGGLQSAESLLIARYLMYSQVYFHPVRRIYDIHLKDFLKAWRQGETFPTDPANHLKLTDHHVMTALFEAADDPHKAGHDAAQRIVCRKHFRQLYSQMPADLLLNRHPVAAIADATAAKFGAENVRSDVIMPKMSSAPDFPVLLRNGDIVSSRHLSDVLQNVPPSRFGYVFIRPELHGTADQWLLNERHSILSTTDVESDEDHE